MLNVSCAIVVLTYKGQIVALSSNNSGHGFLSAVLPGRDAIELARARPAGPERAQLKEQLTHEVSRWFGGLTVENGVRNAVFQALDLKPVLSSFDQYPILSDGSGRAPGGCGIRHRLRVFFVRLPSSWDLFQVAALGSRRTAVTSPAGKLLALLYLCFMIPYRIMLQCDARQSDVQRCTLRDCIGWRPDLFVDYLSDIFFLVDIALNYRCLAFNDIQDGREVLNTSPEAIMQRYRTSNRFVVDVIGSCPVDLLGIPFGGYYTVLRMTHFARIGLLDTYIAELRDHLVEGRDIHLSSGEVSIAKNGFYILVIFHFIAVIWGVLHFRDPSESPYLDAMYWVVTTFTTVGYINVYYYLGLAGLGRPLHDSLTKFVSDLFRTFHFLAVNLFSNVSELFRIVSNPVNTQIQCSACYTVSNNRSHFALLKWCLRRESNPHAQMGDRF